eukprot:4707533-Amphidinium_carterae.1
MHPQQQALATTSANIHKSSNGLATKAEHTSIESVSRLAALDEKPYNAVVKASDNIATLRRNSLSQPF